MTADLINLDIGEEFITFRRMDGATLKLQPIPKELMDAVKAIKDYDATLKSPEQRQAEALTAKLAELMTVDQMLESPDIFPEWSPQMVIVPNMVLRYQDKLYRYTQDTLVTARSEMEPDVTPDLYEELTKSITERP